MIPLVLPAALSAPFRRLGLSGCIIVLLALYGALVTLNTYADISLKGPLGIGVHFEGWAAKARRLAHELDTVTKAQKEAARAQKEVNDAYERKTQVLASKADTAFEQGKDTAMDAAERYIAAHRVRPEGDRSAPGETAASPEGDDTGVREGVPAVAFVAVADSDVRSCTAWVNFGVNARTYLLKLERANNER